MRTSSSSAESPPTSTNPPVDVVVDITIGAPPSTVFALITDITRMGEWSPETVSAGWLGGADHAVEGARFAGRNRLGRMRWTTKPTITRVDPDRTFEFAVPGKSGSTWRYELRPTSSGGTHVTESVRQHHPAPAPIRFMLRRSGVTDRSAHLRDGMTTTLQRLAAAATTTAVATITAAPTVSGATHHQNLA